MERKYTVVNSKCYNLSGYLGGAVIKVLCYKSEGRWFDPSWCQWIFHWHKILPIALLPWGRLSLQQKWVPGVFPGGKKRPVRKADNLPPSCAVVTKCGSLHFLEPSGPVQASNGTALPFLQYVHFFHPLWCMHMRGTLQLIFLSVRQLYFILSLNQSCWNLVNTWNIQHSIFNNHLCIKATSSGYTVSALCTYFSLPNASKSMYIQ